MLIQNLNFRSWPKAQSDALPVATPECQKFPSLAPAALAYAEAFREIPGIRDVFEAMGMVFKVTVATAMINITISMKVKEFWANYNNS